MALTQMQIIQSLGEAIALSKLIKTSRDLSGIPAIKTVERAPYTIQELENGSIEVIKGGIAISPAKPVLRELASELNIGLLIGNGNPFNTRQLGSLIIKALGTQQ